MTHYDTPESNVDMEEVVQHTEGLAEDNGISFGEAAKRMSDLLDGVKASDIIGSQ